MVVCWLLVVITLFWFDLGGVFSILFDYACRLCLIWFFNLLVSFGFGLFVIFFMFCFCLLLVYFVLWFDLWRFICLVWCLLLRCLFVVMGLLDVFSGLLLVVCVDLNISELFVRLNADRVVCNGLVLGLFGCVFGCFAVYLLCWFDVWLIVCLIAYCLWLFCIILDTCFRLVFGSFWLWVVLVCFVVYVSFACVVL